MKLVGVAGWCGWLVWPVGVAGWCGWLVWLVGVADWCGWLVWLVGVAGWLFNCCCRGYFSLLVVLLL